MSNFLAAVYSLPARAGPASTCGRELPQLSPRVMSTVSRAFAPGPLTSSTYAHKDVRSIAFSRENDYAVP
ncbi:MAG: hypothetical protein ACTSPR_04310, partial [Candidatus Thorarchaeota archaeon]